MHSEFGQALLSKKKASNESPSVIDEGNKLSKKRYLSTNTPSHLSGTPQRDEDAPMVESKT